MITGRELLRKEIEQVWRIDRSEVIDNMYHWENGALALKPEHYDLSGWPPGEAEKYTPLLLACFDRGGRKGNNYDPRKLSLRWCDVRNRSSGWTIRAVSL